MGHKMTESSNETQDQLYATAPAFVTNHWIDVLNAFAHEDFYYGNRIINVITRHKLFKRSHLEMFVTGVGRCRLYCVTLQVCIETNDSQVSLRLSVIQST